MTLLLLFLITFPLFSAGSAVEAKRTDSDEAVELRTDLYDKHKHELDFLARRLDVVQALGRKHRPEQVRRWETGIISLIAGHLSACFALYKGHFLWKSARRELSADGKAVRELRVPGMSFVIYESFSLESLREYLIALRHSHIDALIKGAVLSKGSLPFKTDIEFSGLESPIFKFHTKRVAELHVSLGSLFIEYCKLQSDFCVRADDEDSFQERIRSYFTATLKDLTDPKVYESKFKIAQRLFAQSKKSF